MQTGLKNWEVQTGIHRTDFLADTGQTYVSGKALFGRRRKDRGGGSGRQGGNTDINDSVLNDETGEVQGGETIMIQSRSKSIRSS